MVDTTKRHPIRVVARRTGTPETTLRAWERRYGAVRPGRADTGRRLYSDEDVARLLLIRRAIDAGRSVSSVAGMSDSDLMHLIEEDIGSIDERTGTTVPTRRGPDVVSAGFDAVIRMDDVSLRTLLDRASLQLSTILLIDEVISPLIQRIHEYERMDRLSLRHERMASSVIRSLLTQLQARIHNFGSDTLVAAAPPGQNKDLGTYSIGALAASEGWHVVNLGTDIPASDIALAVHEVDASVLALSLMDPSRERQVEIALTFLRNELDDHVLIVASGEAVGDYQRVIETAGVVEIGSAQKLSDVLTGVGDSRMAGT